MDRPTVAGLGGVTFFADRADTLAHWYEKYLGLHFSREPDSHHWWCEVPGGQTFAIHQARHAAGHPRRHAEITWRVADLDGFVAHLADLGVAVDERQEATAGDYARLDDPAGNRVTLYQRRDG
jgi:catechol-2,3-dioxygenase